MPHLQRERPRAKPAVKASFAIHALSREIASLPHVKAILVEQHGDLLTVWTVVDELSPSVQRPIYDAEARLIDRYHQAVNFDFNVMPGDETTSIAGAVPIPIGR